MNALEREFWSNIDWSRSLGGCWLWSGKPNNKGYGRFGGMFAHRVAWLLTHDEPLAKGICVLHRCDTPLCVRPDHLWIGTKGDNRRDCIAKGRDRNQNREKTYCKNRHEFTPENTIVTSLQRICRICANTYQRNWRRNQLEIGKCPTSALTKSARG